MMRSFCIVIGFFNLGCAAAVIFFGYQPSSHDVSVAAYLGAAWGLFAMADR